MEITLSIFAWLGVVLVQALVHWLVSTHGSKKGNNSHGATNVEGEETPPALDASPLVLERRSKESKMQQLPTLEEEEEDTKGQPTTPDNLVRLSSSSSSSSHHEGDEDNNGGHDHQWEEGKISDRVSVPVEAPVGTTADFSMGHSSPTNELPAPSSKKTTMPQHHRADDRDDDVGSTANDDHPTRTVVPTDDTNASSSTGLPPTKTSSKQQDHHQQQYKQQLEAEEHTASTLPLHKEKPLTFDTEEDNSSDAGKEDSDDDDDDDDPFDGDEPELFFQLLTQTGCEMMRSSRSLENMVREQIYIEEHYLATDNDGNGLRQRATFQTQLAVDC